MSNVLRLAFPVVGLLLVSACSRQEAAPAPVRAVRTMTVVPSRAGATLEFAGEIRARTESRLGFRVSGKIVRRSAELGAAVKRGQVLAQIDPQDLDLARLAARAGSSAAQANVDQADADYKRFKELRDQGFISTAELERRETALKSARAQEEQARAQEKVQGNQAAYSSLVADADGVITAIEAEPGMVVSAGSPVLRLAQDGPRDVVFSVAEDKVSMLRALAGKSGALKVRLWNHGGEWLPATVREVAAAADPATRTFLIKADVGRPDVKLGQTATVQLDLPKQGGVALLPLTAVFELKGKSSVWVLDATTMTVRPQTIEASGTDGNQVVVAAGLSPGQQVVTAGVHVLVAGQKVKRYGGSAEASGAAPVAGGLGAVSSK